MRTPVALAMALSTIGCATGIAQADKDEDTERYVSGTVDLETRGEWNRVAREASRLPGFLGTHSEAGLFYISLHGDAVERIASMTQEPTIRGRDIPLPAEAYRTKTREIIDLIVASNDGAGVDLDMRSLLVTVTGIENGNGDLTTCNTYPLTSLASNEVGVVDSRDCP